MSIYDSSTLLRSDRFLKIKDYLKQRMVDLNLSEHKKNMALAFGAVLFPVAYLIAVMISKFIFNCLFFGVGYITSVIGFAWILQFVLKKRRQNVESAYHKAKTFLIEEILDLDRA